MKLTRIIYEHRLEKGEFTTHADAREKVKAQIVVPEGMVVSGGSVTFSNEGADVETVVRAA